MRKRLFCTLLALSLLLPLLPVSSRAASMHQEFLAQGAQIYTDSNGTQVLLSKHLYDSAGTLRQKDLLTPQGALYLTELYRPDGTLARTLRYDSAGMKAEYITEYDAQGEPAAEYTVFPDGSRKAQRLHQSGRDTENQLLYRSISSGEGNALETYFYDYSDTRFLYSLHRMTFDSLGGVESYDILCYDSSDRLAAHYRKLPKEGEATVTGYEYVCDYRGKLTQMDVLETRDGTETHVSRTCYSYDSRGRLILEQHTDDPASKSPVTVSTWEYDTSGRLSRWITGGQTWEFSYLPLSRLLYTGQQPEAVPEPDPEEEKPQPAPEAPLPDGNALYLAEGTEFLTEQRISVQCTYAYDENGTLRQKTEQWPESGPHYIYEYREDGTLLRRLRDFGQDNFQPDTEYDNYGFPLREFRYENGQQKVAAGYFTAYDSLGRCLHRSRFVPEVGLSAAAAYIYREDGSYELHDFSFDPDRTLSHHTVSRHDRFGNTLVRYRDWEDGENHCYYFDAEFDDRGNVTREMLNWVDVLPKEENYLIPYYIYENCYEGDLLTQVNRYQTDCYYEEGKEQFSEPLSQGRTYFVYDDRGNLLEERHGEKTASFEDSIVVYTWEYDDRGSLIRYTDVTGTYEYTYRPLSQLLTGR